MDFVTPFILAAALAYCERAPEAAVCHSRDVTAIEWQANVERRIERAAATLRETPHYQADARDYWREASADETGDCEDYILALARRLEREDPELLSAFRVVMLVMERRDAGPTTVHIVGVVETTRGSIIINAGDAPRRWADLRADRREAYTPVGALSGPWAPYSGS